MVANYSTGQNEFNKELANECSDEFTVDAKPSCSKSIYAQLEHIFEQPLVLQISIFIVKFSARELDNNSHNIHYHSWWQKFERFKISISQRNSQFVDVKRKYDE
jgi:hypothetical protein